MPRKSQDYSQYLLPAAVVIGGYLILSKLGLIGVPTSTRVSDKCPRGMCYSRGLFEDCDPNYVSRGLIWNDICDCLDADPKCPGAPLQPAIDQLSGNPILPILRPFRLAL